MGAIFSILYQSDKGVIHTGTGFLVYKHGLFLTAGHVFRKKENSGNKPDKSKFRAVFFQNGNPIMYEMKHIYYKSYDIWKQKSPEYFDIAIGELEDCDLDYLKVDRRRPAIGCELYATAFVGLEGQLYGTNFSNLEHIELLNRNKLRMTVIEDDAIITDLPQYYQMPREKVPVSYFYNNCITLSNKFVKSSSGCPILDSKGSVRCMLIGAPTDEKLSMTFAVLAKHCSKSIQFKTHYLYNPYEYM